LEKILDSLRQPAWMSRHWQAMIEEVERRANEKPE